MIVARECLRGMSTDYLDVFLSATLPIGRLSPPSALAPAP